MLRSKALRIIASQIVHVCPYKGQDVLLHLCYRRSQDIADEFCYACDYVPVLKRKFGLRTFKRKVISARCVHCDEYASLHEREPPHRGTRVTTCPGFEPQTHDEGLLWVALNKACTEWMVVDNATGERKTLAQHREPCVMPKLVGAPDEVSDWRDSERVIAAEQASKRRVGQEKGNKKLKQQKDNDK